MAWAEKAMLCLCIVLGGTAMARASATGSLAPHGAEELPGIQQRQQQWIADPRTRCQALDINFNSGDSIAWPGYCPGGLVTGTGTLTFLRRGLVIQTVTSTFTGGVLQPGHVSAVWADGSKYDGNQSNGLFDGEGTFSSASGDKLEGKWTGGELDGVPQTQAAQPAAGGAPNEGAAPVVLSGGVPGGTPATEKPAHAPGQSAVQPATVGENSSPPTHVASAAPSFPPKADNTAVPSQASLLPLRPLLGKTLVSVDGSTFDLKETEGGLTRVVTSPNGTSLEITFALMNDRIGTVSNDSAAIGLFRASSSEVEIDYTDGQTETLRPTSEGGMMMAAQAADGTMTCRAWYPQGHVFTKDEREAAVLEYATRLGVAPPPPQKKLHGTAHPSTPGCGGPRPGGVAASGLTAVHSSLLADAAASLPDEETDDLQTVPVGASFVHTIDARFDSEAHPARVQQANFAIDAVSAPAQPLAPPSAQAQGSAGRSDCLQVTSNGQYWGFQNRCTSPLQFAYCEMSDVNPLTSCHLTSVSGSVAASGFSALVGDRSLAERDVKHDFRWLACEGGAGEVVPHLDHFDPPAGRCLRVISAVN
jgi:hypothetical protein